MKTPEEILSQYIFDTDSIDGLSYDDAITCMNELAAIRAVEFHKWRCNEPNQVTCLLSIKDQYDLFITAPTRIPINPSSAYRSSPEPIER